MTQHRALWLFAAVLLIALSTACSTAPTKPETGFAAFAAQPAKVNPLATFEMVSSHLPPDTALVATVDVNSTMSFYKALGIVPEDWDSTAMDNDLRKHIITHLGADFTKTEWVTVAWAPPERLYIFAYGNLGKLQGSQKNTAEGLTFHTAKERDVHVAQTSTPKLYLVLAGPGMPGNALSWRSAPNKASLQTSTQGTLLRNVLKDAQPAYYSIAFQGTHPMISEVLRDAPMELPKAVSFYGSQDNARLRMHGSPESLNGLVKLLKDQSAEFKKELTREMSTLPEKDFFEGMLTIVGYHMIDPVTEQFTPKVKGDLMTLDMSPAAGVVMLYGASFGAMMVPMMMMGNTMPLDGMPMAPAPVEAVPSPKTF